MQSGLWLSRDLKINVMPCWLLCTYLKFVLSVEGVSLEPEAVHLTSDGSTYSSESAYSMSKLYLIMFGYQLEKKLRGTKLCVNSVDPGTLLK